MNLKGILGGLVALALAGCGKDPCDHTSPCANDPKPSKDSIAACKKAEQASQNSLCFTETSSYASCFNDILVCGADGKADLKATGTKATTLCAAQLTAFTNCCNTNPASAACQ